MAHRSTTLIPKSTRRRAAFAQDTSGEEKRVPCQFRLILLIEGLLLWRAALGALLHRALFILLFMLVGPLEYLVDVFDETHSILILTF